MFPFSHSRTYARGRGRYLPLLLGAIGTAALASGCGEESRPQPLGTCTQPNGTVVGTMTQQECTNQCPECTWVESGGAASKTGITEP